ncbi:Ribonuclease J [Rickettsiales endosymbiont of Paramecium tredecaurelia]|uniref:ribonuclease J n=1 Tax=Candidatus Sarmatiella mevalonica TaxID=2770581 RepID=UPI001921238F|nr:ribonuclease J [Candidatus Sarmatiella mevalonica]MBL3284810.1 Ribonuclease J [Candidatus Sarmatiella mevalonica]
MSDTSIDFRDYENNLLFIPLGGSNEIGMNVNLYHYHGKWLMVDCGSGFADDRLPGVDMIVANLDFIVEKKDDLLGIVLTHAHEDHLGGVQYLIDKLECNIYATNFTANFLKVRLAEFGVKYEDKIITVEPEAKISLTPFELEMIGLTHSAPEMQAIMVRTAAGNVLHTGDWKFDTDPLLGSLSNTQALEACGNEGVLALVCDSTNVFKQGKSLSEGELKASLVNIVRECKKMVTITTFASNLARLSMVIDIAKQVGRKVVLTGRSLNRVLSSAQASGYLQDLDHMIDEGNIGKYKREEVLVVATGCQAEPLAACAKIANNEHKSINFAPGDTVIFSSKIIPGNDIRIFRLFNQLIKSKIEIITEKSHFVHVSGHPPVEELKMMYALTKPKICIPVHGEPFHIHEHAKLAKRSGVPAAIEVENGSVVLLSQDDSRIIGKVPTGYLAVDGHFLIPTDSHIFTARRKIRDLGICVVHVILNKNDKVVHKPNFLTPGLLDTKLDSDLIDSVKSGIVEEIIAHRSKYLATKGDGVFANSGRYAIDNREAETIIRQYVRRILRNKLGKTPMVLVTVDRI